VGFDSAANDFLAFLLSLALEDDVAAVAEAPNLLKVDSVALGLVFLGEVGGGVRET